MDSINLRVYTPVCSFRKPYAREYLETERFPSPATIYGFLLSLVGEEDRNKYIGTQLAYAITHEAEISRVLRTVWRVKDKKVSPGTNKNKRPDYQEILTGLELAIWVAKGDLVERLKKLSENPAEISRYGGLSLGESKDLVDEVEIFPAWHNKTAAWLVKDDRGEYPLPVWVDHVGSKGTNWEQFRLNEQDLNMPLKDDPRWITIEPRGI